MRNLKLKFGIAILISLMVIGFFAVQGVKEDNKVDYQEHLVIDSQLRFASISNKLHDYETISLSVRQLFLSSEFVTREEFNIFVNPILYRNTEIQAIEYIPEVFASERRTYEEKAHEDGLADYQIKGLIDGELIKSPVKDKYYPVYYIQPYEGNEVALGLDLGSNTTRMETLMYAKEWGKAVISEPVQLVQDSENVLSFLMIHAIQQNGKINGFVLIAYRIDDFVEESLDVHESVGLELVILDTTKGQEQVIYESSKSQSVKSYEAIDVNHIEKMAVGGREWTLMFVPSKAYEEIYLSKSENTIIFAIAILIFALTIYLYNTWKIETKLEMRIEEQVEEIKEGQLQLQLALEGAGQAIWDWDLVSNKTIMGDNWINLVGYTHEELNEMEDPWKVLIHPIDYKRVQDIIQRFLKGQEPYYHAEYRIVKRDGSIGWFYDEGRFFGSDALGNPTRCAGTVHDVTEIVRLREELREKAIIDPLTELYNRRYLFDQLKQFFTLHKRHEQQYSFTILDIDYFKKVNDTYGHQIGDAVLSHFACYLKGRFRSTDLIARYGGEEFVVVMHEVSLEKAYNLIEEVRREIEENILSIGTLEITYTFSAGVVSFDEVETLEEVINLADERLYAAKETGRNKVIAD